MSVNLSFSRRFAEIIIPTPGQVFAAIIISVVILAGCQSKTILVHLGITSHMLSLSGGQLKIRFNAIISSPLAGQAALVTFWAVVGLITYLVCWGGYNIFIEARNEVTLHTSYTNRGHWRGPYETLALKSLSALGLAIWLGLSWRGLSLWLAMFSRAVNYPLPSAIGYGALATLGFAAQLYLALVLVQLTFTPWYRPEAFTQV